VSYRHLFASRSERSLMYSVGLGTEILEEDNLKYVVAFCTISVSLYAIAFCTIYVSLYAIAFCTIYVSLYAIAFCTISVSLYAIAFSAVTY
jgi:hypothetical protein